MSHVVHDADREVQARRRIGELIENRLDHRRCEFLAREAVASADDSRSLQQRIGVGGKGPNKARHINRHLVAPPGKPVARRNRGLRNLRLVKRAFEWFEQWLSKVKDVIRKLEIEERGFGLLVLRWCWQNVVGQASGLGHRDVDDDQTLEGL